MHTACESPASAIPALLYNYIIIIYEHFNICCFIAVAYTILNRLRAVFFIYLI